MKHLDFILRSFQKIYEKIIEHENEEERKDAIELIDSLLPKLVKQN